MAKERQRKEKEHIRVNKSDAVRYHGIAFYGHIAFLLRRLFGAAIYFYGVAQQKAHIV